MAVKKTPKKTVTKKKVSKTDVVKTLSVDQKPVIKTGKKNFKYVVLGIFLVLILALLYLMKGVFIAAFVNGKPITRLSLIKELEKSQGQTTLENLVEKEIVLQEARKQNAIINLEDIQPDLEDIAKRLEGEGTTLDAALASEGWSRHQFEEDYRMRKMLEKILEPELAVSDEEIMKYFEENKEMLGENPNYEDLKENIRQQIKYEKFNFESEKWFNEKRNESDIIYNISF